MYETPQQRWWQKKTGQTPLVGTDLWQHKYFCRLNYIYSYFTFSHSRRRKGQRHDKKESWSERTSGEPAGDLRNDCNIVICWQQQTQESLAPSCTRYPSDAHAVGGQALLLRRNKTLRFQYGHTVHGNHGNHCKCSFNLINFFCLFTVILFRWMSSALKSSMQQKLLWNFPRTAILVIVRCPTLADIYMNPGVL